jgi:hypothetical protein
MDAYNDAHGHPDCDAYLQQQLDLDADREPLQHTNFNAELHGQLKLDSHG